MKKQQKMFMAGDRPVVVTKGAGYAEVSLYSYNGYYEVSISREWELDKNKDTKRPANKEELAGAKKLIAALQEIVAYAEKW